MNMNFIKQTFKLAIPPKEQNILTLQIIKIIFFV